MAKPITGASSGICGEPHADLCPETGHNVGHRCERPAQHDDGMRHPHHECACERRWMGGPTLPKIERATVVEVRTGDVLVFETDRRNSDSDVEAFRSNVREAVSQDIDVILSDKWCTIIAYTLGALAVLGILAIVIRAAVIAS